jgi:hypothetical protein
MADSWQKLRVGDRIRFIRVPPIYSNPDYRVSPETLSLYTLLVSTGDSIQIDDFTEYGAPVAGYVDRRDNDGPVFHGLVINADDDGCWERVAGG